MTKTMNADVKARIDAANVWTDANNANGEAFYGEVPDIGLVRISWKGGKRKVLLDDAARHAQQQTANRAKGETVVADVHKLMLSARAVFIKGEDENASIARVLNVFAAKAAIKATGKTASKVNYDDIVTACYRQTRNDYRKAVEAAMSRVELFAKMVQLSHDIATKTGDFDYLPMDIIDKLTPMIRLVNAVPEVAFGIRETGKARIGELSDEFDRACDDLGKVIGTTQKPARESDHDPVKAELNRPESA